MGCKWPSRPHHPRPRAVPRPFRACLWPACRPPTPQQGRLPPRSRLQEGLVPVVLHEAAGGERGGGHERAGAKVGAPAVQPVGLAGTPGPQARGGGSGRAAEPAATPRLGWRLRVLLPACSFPISCRPGATLCWEETPPSWPTVPPSPAARHSKVPGYAPGLSALVNTCAGTFSCTCPLLSLPHQPPVFGPLSGLSSALCSNMGSSGPALILFPSRAP